jgi:hypothetical protein
LRDCIAGSLRERAKYSEVKGGIPGLKPTEGRIFFYRNTSMLVGGALQPSVRLNGATVGGAIPGGFFFLDRSPGPMEVSLSTEVERKLTFDLKAGDVRYVHMYVGMGLLVGRLYPELVDASVGQKDIEGLSYIGDPLKQ